MPATASLFFWSRARWVETIAVMKTTHLILLSLITLASAALAVDPPPDGGYPNQNTAEGTDALLELTTGADNTALGYVALSNTTTGYQNTAVGSSTLAANTTGALNVAVGYAALQNNTTGSNNIGVGLAALQNNTTGFSNIGIGPSALQLNTSGVFNTALGLQALGFNTAGNNNVAIGQEAMISNQTGSVNTAVGIGALGANTQGNNNIGLGNGAGKSCTGDNNIAIGHPGHVGKSGQIIIGTRKVQTSAMIAGISGVTVPGGVGVVVDTLGNLGTVTSSARYKEAIKPMQDASSAILSLQPVTFRYKKELDPDAIPQFGLVAEQVAKVDPDLVARDESGKPYTVRYEAVNAMLLNEFLKEHRKVEALEATVAKLQATIEKVSARVEGTEPTPRLVSAE
jgi:hypothetical protein